MPTNPAKPAAKPAAKPTIEPDQADDTAGQREPARDHRGGVKPPVDDERGKNYGQREGSTVTQDNDVE